MKNIDKIKGMTIDGLTDLLYKSKCMKCIFLDDTTCRSKGAHCEEGIKKWLMQEEKPTLPNNIKAALAELATYCDERNCDMCYFQNKDGSCDFNNFKEDPCDLTKLIGE